MKFFKRNKALFTFFGALSWGIFFSLTPLSLAQTSTTESGIQVQAGFSDVPNTHQYYTAITYLSDEGVIGGYADGRFLAEKEIVKADALKIILAGSGIQTDVPFAPNFPDVVETDWFAPFVMKAESLGLVKGNQTDGTFTGSKQVNTAEFLKMLLLANKIDVSSFEGKSLDPAVPADAWFASYLNYAISLGIVPRNSQGKVDPGQLLTRGQVVNSIYLLTIIMNGKDTQFLLTRAEREMAQIDPYIADNKVAFAKNASELANDIMQQAFKNMPDNNIVVGAAKLAKAYDWLVDAFILGIQGKYQEAAQKANEVIDKASEAWEANNAVQPIAKHIKERARDILEQVGGVES